jgi:hypothetical protein
MHGVAHQFCLILRKLMCLRALTFLRLGWLDALMVLPWHEIFSISLKMRFDRGMF